MRTHRRFPGAAWLWLIPLGAVLASCGTRLSDSELLPSSTAPAASPTSAATSGPSNSSLPNTASDVGVTPTDIAIGLIVSKTSPLGEEVFSGPSYGTQAFFAAQNARGGINGRKVKVIVCDDASVGSGNRRCVRKLIDDDKVFAFVGNSIMTYAGAEYVQSSGVPDIGSQPVTTAYDQYSHLFQIYGSDAPRNGTVGFDGKLRTGTEIYRYFKLNLGTTTAAIVEYNQADSLRYAALLEAGLKAEGYRVVREQVDLAVPNWEAVAIDMHSRGVDSVFNAMDMSGNVALCKAMDGLGYTVKANVLSVQSWTETVRSDFGSTPGCRKNLYVTGRTLNYADTQVPIVAQFRKGIAATFPARADKLSMWTLEGWAGAQWFTDAAASCGAELTRTCVETYMNRSQPYDGHGLFDPRTFVPGQPGATTGHNCLSVARWDDTALDGRGEWVSQTPVGEFVCYDTPNVEYTP